MPLSSSTVPETAALSRRPRPYLPALIPGGVVALFLLTLGWLGHRYELRPADEFHPQRIIQHVMNDTAAERLGRTADGLEVVADGFEAERFRPGVSDTAVKRLASAGALSRARGDSLRARVGSREVILAKRHAKRLLWIYASSVDLVICILGGLIALGVTFVVLRMRDVSRSWALIVMVAMIVLSLPAALLFYGTWYDSATPPYRLVRVALGDGVLSLARVSDGLHILTVTLIMWAGVFTTPSRPMRAPGAAPAGDAAIVAAARELAEGTRLFRLGLYVAAALLVVYVAAVASLFQWALAFVNPDQTVYGGVEALANSAVTARGILASGLLVFGFGASAVMVRLMGLSLATRALPEGSITDHETWTLQQGLVVTGLRQHLKTLAVVLSPFLTGVLAQVLQTLAT